MSSVVQQAGRIDRRSFLRASAAAAAVVSIGCPSSSAHAAALTEASRDAMTPAEIIAMLKEGNARFRRGEKTQRDYLAEQKASAKGQYPALVILSCIDSRAPAEIVMDLGIGDAFNARVAGNIADPDILGSMEFACQVSGAKVALVMGHTACGAIKGAIDGVQLGNLTGLLEKIRPAVEATQFDGARTSKNAAFVDAVARKNVELTMAAVRRQSTTLNDLAEKHALEVAGAMYDLDTGAVTFM